MEPYKTYKAGYYASCLNTRCTLSQLKYHDSSTVPLEFLMFNSNLTVGSERVLTW